MRSSCNLRLRFYLAALVVKTSVRMTVSRRAHPAIAAEAKLALLLFGILTVVFIGLAVGFCDTSLSLSGAALFAPRLLTPNRGSKSARILQMSSSEISATNAPKHNAWQH